MAQAAKIELVGNGLATLGLIMPRIFKIFKISYKVRFASLLIWENVHIEDLLTQS